MLFLDRLILSTANAWLYLCHFKLIREARRRHGWWPNVASPKRYSERMLWRKLVDRCPHYAVFCDKLLTKAYTQQRCPELPVPRTLWVGVDADAIPSHLFDHDVMVKTSHASSYNMRMTGGQADRQELKRQMTDWMAETYGETHGEWGYSQVTPRLYVEQIVGTRAQPMVEFEIRVASGRVLFASMVGKNKTPQQWRVYLKLNGEIDAPVTNDKTVVAVVPEPVNFQEGFQQALRHAAVIGEEIDYTRIDFFWDGEQLYAGEITMYPAAGITEMVNPETNALILSNWRLLDAGVFRLAHGWPARAYFGALRRTLEREERKRG